MKPLSTSDELERLDEKLGDLFSVWLRVILGSLTVTALALAFHVQGLATLGFLVAATAFLLLILNMGHARALDTVFSHPEGSRLRAVALRCSTQHWFEVPLAALCIVAVWLLTDALDL